MSAQTKPALERLFRSHRAFLWGLAYRVTGTAADADEVVQETFLRAAQHTLPATEEEIRKWLTRVATNAGLDVLRRRRRVRYVGVWLPAPIEVQAEKFASDPAPQHAAHQDPATRYEMTESVSFAFMIALEALGARQRAVLLLRDVFGYSARETSEVVGISEENVRITHYRARRGHCCRRVRCLGRFWSLERTFRFALSGTASHHTPPTPFASCSSHQREESRYDFLRLGSALRNACE